MLPTFLFSYVINQVENFPPTLLFGPAVLLGTLEYSIKKQGKYILEYSRS